MWFSTNIPVHIQSYLHKHSYLTNLRTKHTHIHTVCPKLSKLKQFFQWFFFKLVLLKFNSFIPVYFPSVEAPLKFCSFYIVWCSTNVFLLMSPISLNSTLERNLQFRTQGIFTQSYDWWVRRRNAELCIIQ